MSNPFADYGKRATSTAPAALLGPLKTRSASRERYGEIVSELQRAAHSEELEIYLLSINPEIVQFRVELEFFWSGDGDFLGLEKEIELARARLDDGLDFPRWDVGEVEEQMLKMKETGQ